MHRSPCILHGWTTRQASLRVDKTTIMARQVNQAGRCSSWRLISWLRRRAGGQPLAVLLRVTQKRSKQAKLSLPHACHLNSQPADRRIPAPSRPPLLLAPFKRANAFNSQDVVSCSRFLVRLRSDAHICLVPRLEKKRSGISHICLQCGAAHTFFGQVNQ